MADGSDTEIDEQGTLVQRAVSTAVRPVQVLTSRSAVKTYLSTILFLVTSIGLLTLSTTAYGFFYYNYIPQINLERTIYLQYGQGSHPHATTPLETTALISQQPYDIELILHMPRTPSNLNAGNFMLDLSLITEGPALPSVAPKLSPFLPNITTGTILHHSRRPTILPFSSPILSLSHTFMHLPFHLLSLRDLDSELLSIPMFELLSFPRGTRNIPTHVRVELQSTATLQIYKAAIAFRARFQGLRYLIYNHRVLAFLTFTTVFYTVAIATMAVAWALMSSVFASADPSTKYTQKKIKEEPDTTSAGSNGHISTSKSKTIKAEAADDDDDDSASQGLSLSNLSDTAANFPSGRGQMPLRFPVGSGGLSTSSIPAPVSVERPTQPSEVADDENEDEEDGPQASQAQGRPDRDIGDSGIGTSMESEHTGAGIVRRRSSRQSLGRG